MRLDFRTRYSDADPEVPSLAEIWTDETTRLIPPWWARGPALC